MVRRKKIEPEGYNEGDWTQDITLHGTADDDYYKDED